MSERSSGWHPDPSGRHALRYFAGGVATDLVRDGDVESVDEIAGPASDAWESPGAGAVSVEGPEPPVGAHTAKASSPGGAGMRGAWIAAAVAAGILVAIVAVGIWRTRPQSSVSDAPTSTAPAPKTTKQLADELETVLCAKSTKPKCSVDGSRSGVIEVRITDDLVGDAELDKAGAATGLWTAADVARMVHTRALDGMQRSVDGKASWTYHPDHGLQIVVDLGSGSG